MTNYDKIFVNMENAAGGIAGIKSFGSRVRMEYIKKFKPQSVQRNKEI